VNGTKRALIAIAGIGTIGTAAAWLWLHPHKEVPKPPPTHAAYVAPVPPPTSKESVAIGRGDTLETLLDGAGVEEPDRSALISAARSVFDVRKFRAGSSLNLTRLEEGNVDSLDYIIDPDHELRVARTAGGFEAIVVTIPGEIRVVPVCGTMQDSLFDSMERIGERSELAIAVADIFAWDLDFYTDPQPGDSFCVVLEKKEYANGQPSTYKRILAARYVNAGKTYEGYLFADGGGKAGYYSRDGHSLQAAFLRSPLKFDARVSSHFSRRRFHPVLKIYRPHLGTDYAAPVGAPVQAVASGRVTFRGRSGGAGNMVRIRHANGYESMYLHLSRMYVRVGQTVEQGQRIAAVGATGLATGPHLDFRLRRNGSFVNFERLKSPRAVRLAAAEMETFTHESAALAALMDEALRTAPSLVAGSASSVVADGAGAQSEQRAPAK
jgi:murein DD-endopeptidase MepM/ murein hydrolase activator NlpD